MGCCAVRNSKFKVSITTVNIANRLSETKELLVKSIYDLHNINLQLSQDIETSIIEANKTSAILLKERKLCIKIKHKEIQDLIFRIDECLEKTTKDLKESLEVEKLAKKAIFEVENGVEFEMPGSSNGKDESYAVNLRKELVKYNLNACQIEKEIDEEIKTREKSLKNGHFVRRKYKKLKPSG